MFVSVFLNRYVETFSSDIKQSRMLADILNDLALSIEIALPYVPESCVAFLMLLATTMKCMCGFIAGATRAAITAHFALDGNEAEVAVKVRLGSEKWRRRGVPGNNYSPLPPPPSKEGNQENLVTVVGLVMGGAFVKFFSSEVSIIVAFVVLTFLHIIFNMMAVWCLRLRKLNFQRFHIAVALYYNNFSPTNKLVNWCESLWYSQPKGAWGAGRVEDFLEVMESNPDYHVSEDRVFFRRGADRAMGYFHFLMLRGENDDFFKYVRDEAKDFVSQGDKQRFTER